MRRKPPPAAEAGARNGVNSSALQGFRVLRLVSQAQEPLGVAEIGRRLDMPTTTVHRALVLLEQSRYLSRLETAPRYEPGLMPQTLARALFRRFALREAALPVLRRIARETGETTALGVRLGWAQVRVAVVYGSKDLCSPGELGQVRLLHQGLAARSILAFLPEAETRRYRQHVRAAHPARLAELDDAALAQALAETRRRGFAAEPLDHAQDRVAVALPLRRGDDEPVGSILVNGPVAAIRRGAVARPSWAAQVDALERALRARPELSAHPYAHLDPDAIAAGMPLSGDEGVT